MAGEAWHPLFMHRPVQMKYLMRPVNDKEKVRHHEGKKRSGT